MLLRLTAVALAAAASFLNAGCACPPRTAAYDTPLDALRSWQSSLCADDVEGEYRALSASLRRRMRGFPTYDLLRARLLDERPAAAWLFARADLADHLVETSYDEDGRTAWLSFDARGETIHVAFEREAFVSVVEIDGTERSARQELPLEGLLAVQDERQWLAFPLPRLPQPLSRLRSLALTTRWTIADVGGLAQLAPEGVQP